MKKNLIILFGYPGAGKTYAGRLLQESFGYYFYDGDDDMTSDMHEAIKTQIPFSKSMRDAFFEKLITRIEKLTQQYAKVAVAQTFIKEQYREQIRKHFPNAVFLYVQTENSVRESRLAKRQTVPLTKSYAQQMIDSFDEPKGKYFIIDNTSEGKEEIKKQLEII